VEIASATIIKKPSKDWLECNKNRSKLKRINLMLRKPQMRSLNMIY